MGLTDTIANLYLQKGAAQAQGQERVGQLYGSLISNLGQLPGQIQQQEQQRQAAQQEQQIRGLQITQAQRDMAAQDALGKAMSSAVNPDGSFNTDLLQKSVLANPVTAAQWPKISEGLTAAQEKSAQVRKLADEHDAAERDHVSALANAADAVSDPTEKAGVLLAGLAQGAKAGTIDPAHATSIVGQLLGDDGNPDPQKVTAVLGQMKQLSAADVEKRAQAAKAGIDAARAQAELPGIAAETATKQAVAAGMTNGMTAAQAAEVQSRNAQMAREAAANAETARHNRIEEGLAGQREAREGATGVGIEVKPDSREYRIAQDLAYGKLTFADFNRIYGRAMGNAAVKAGIYDTARQLNPQFDPAQFELGFKLAGNPQIRQRLVAIDSLNPVIDKAETLADQVGNSDIPAFNRLLMGAKFQVGNRTVTNFRQLQTLLGDEVGNALGVGAGSDLKTRLGLDLVNPNLSPAAFKDTMEQLRNVLAARKQSLLGTMGPYATGAQGTGAPAQSAAPTTAAPNLSGLAKAQARTFNTGPFAGQTWTLGADGTPSRVK